MISPSQLRRCIMGKWCKWFMMDRSYRRKVALSLRNSHQHTQLSYHPNSDRHFQSNQCSLSMMVCYNYHMIDVSWYTNLHHYTRSILVYICTARLTARHCRSNLRNLLQRFQNIQGRTYGNLYIGLHLGWQRSLIYSCTFHWSVRHCHGSLSSLLKMPQFM